VGGGIMCLYLSLNERAVRIIKRRKSDKGNLEESIGTDTFAKYFQKDLPIRCQKLQQERIIFRTKNKKRSRCFV
jgi:hypothetical protein